MIKVSFVSSTTSTQLRMPLHRDAIPKQGALPTAQNKDTSKDVCSMYCVAYTSSQPCGLWTPYCMQCNGFLYKNVISEDPINAAKECPTYKLGHHLTVLPSYLSLLDLPTMWEALPYQAANIVLSKVLLRRSFHSLQRLPAPRGHVRIQPHVAIQPHLCTPGWLDT